MRLKLIKMKEMPELNGFTGTEGYHRWNILTSMTLTDGTKYLADEVGCYWLFDIVASVQTLPKVKEYNGFIIWILNVKNKEAFVSGYYDCETDGSYSPRKRVYQQKISYTDFPEGVFEFYQEGNVILLKSEH